MRRSGAELAQQAGGIRGELPNAVGAWRFSGLPMATNIACNDLKTGCEMVALEFPVARAGTQSMYQQQRRSLAVDLIMDFHAFDDGSQSCLKPV